MKRKKQKAIWFILKMLKFNFNFLLFTQKNVDKSKTLNDSHSLLKDWRNRSFSIISTALFFFVVSCGGISPENGVEGDIRVAPIDTPTEELFLDPTDVLVNNLEGVELTEKRTSNSKTFANPDGTKTTRITTGPTHYLKDEEWVDLQKAQTTFHSSTSKSGFDLTVEDNPIQVFFKEKAENGIYRLDFHHEDIHLSWQPTTVTAPAKKGGTFLTKTAQTAKVTPENNRLLLNQVFDGIREEIVMLPGTAKHNIILSKKLEMGNAEYFSYEGKLTAKADYDWYLDGEKIENGEYRGKGLEVRSSSGAHLVFPPPFAFEQNSEHDDVVYGQYAIKKNGKNITLGLMIPAIWLMAPEREYPVVIDPTISLPNMCSSSMNPLTGYVWWDSSVSRWQYSYSSPDGIKTGWQLGSYYYHGYAEWGVLLTGSSVGSITSASVSFKSRYFNDANRDGSNSTRLYHMSSRPSASTGNTIYSDARDGNYYGYVQWTGNNQRKPLALPSTGRSDLLSRITSGSGWFAVGLRPWADYQPSVDPNDQVFVHSNYTATSVCDYPTLEITYTEPGDAYEPNNNSGQATRLSANSDTIAISIDPETDQDWFDFVLSERSNVTLEIILAGTNNDTRMWLYNSSLTQVDYNDDITPGSNFLSRITRSGSNALEAGTYYVKIDEYGNNSVINPYSLSFGATAAPINYAPTATLTAPNSGNNMSTSSTSLTVSATCSDSNSNLSSRSLENITTGQIVPASITGGNNSFSSPINLNIGSNTIRVTCTDTNGLTGTDTMTITRYGDSYEPDDSSGQATELSHNYTSANHTIIPATDVDWYYFTLNSTATITLETNGSSGGDTRMWLYNSGISELESDDDDGPNNFSMISRQLGAGNYYVKVDEYQNNDEISNYGLSLSVTFNRAPSAIITGPNGGNDHTTNNSSETIDGRCDDADGNLSSINILNTTNGNSSNPSVSNTSTQSFSRSVSLDYGWNGIQLTCTDSSGSTGADSIFIYRDPAPSVSFRTPGNGSIGTSSPIAFGGNCYDSGSNLSSVVVRNETSGWSQSSNISGSDVTFDVNVNLVPGSNTLSATCTDSTGKTASNSLNTTYDVCPDYSQKDSVGNTCTHNDCANFSLHDRYNDVCNHDEDNDSISDDSDACPGYANDSFNDPCSANDNFDFSFSGSDINVRILQGTTSSTQQFAVTNNGNVNLVYSFTTSSSAPWLNLVKNGGDTGALNNTHTLPGGQVDRFTASLNANDLAAGTTVSTTLLVSSNDSSSGTAEIPIALTSEQVPYCAELMCEASPDQFLGNQNLVTHTVSDPISTATGNYAYHHTDLTIPTSRGFDLSFTRTYNTQDTYLGPLGYGWTHAYNIFVTNFQDGSVHIKWPDAHTEIFKENVDGSYQAPKGVLSTLTDSDTGGFELTTKSKTVFRFATGTGRLTEVEDRKGNKLTFTYDIKDRLEKVEDLSERFFTFQYGGDDSLKIVSVTDSTDRSISFGYTDDDLTSFTDTEENTYQYIYDDKHRLTEITDPLDQRLVNNTYDEYSRVIEQRDGLNRLTQLDYDPTEIGRVTVTDPLNQTLTQVYDNQFRITESHDPAGNAITYQYNSNNLRIQATDRENLSSNASYDSNGNLLSITNSTGQQTTFEYNEDHDVTKMTLPDGYERNFEYDDKGNLTRTWETVDEETIETTYDYNEWGQTTSVTDPNGNTTTYEYDVKGNLESVTPPDDSVTQFTYDNLGRITSITNPLEETTQFEYNKNNQLTKITHSDGHTTRYEYDANGKPTKVIDRKGNETQFTYNANGFLETLRNALGDETAFVYDSLNRRTQITDPENRTTRFTYNAAGFPTQITDPAGKTVQFVYDKEGNLTSKTDGSGQIWTYGYNDRKQVISIIDPLENETQYAYDEARGYLTEITDAEENTTEFTYDNLGRLKEVTNPLGQTTTFDYDANGNLTSLTNAARATTTFSYDALGRKTEQTNALDQTEEYFYDLAGRISKTVDVKEQETNFNYDHLGRLTSMVFADERTTTFTYDENGNRLSVENENGTASSSYDSLNRLTRQTDVHGFELQYQYDKTGLLTRLIYPENKTVQYQYNATRQLSSVVDWLDHTTQYTYDTAGRLSQVTLPNGLSTSYIYDTASRLITLHNKKADGTTLTRYDLTLNANGNRTEIVRDGELAPWLLAEDTDATFNLENALLTHGGFNLGYDANGNLITLSADTEPTTYQWDVLDQLTNIQQPDGDTFAFIYDGNGNRVQRTENGVTTQFLVDSNRRLPDVLAEANEEGAIQKYYIYGLGLLAQANADGSEVRYYHYDPIGSTAALSSAAGVVTDQYLYDPYGNLNRHVGDTENPFQFVGQFGVQNDETDLYFMRARYYNPAMGRFISKDPIGFLGGSHLYGYSDNNPVSNIDPSGHVLETPWDALNVGIGIVSLADNINNGEWGWAALDVVGLIYDGIATGVPFLPGGASTGLRALQTGNKVVDAVNVGTDFVRATDKAHDYARMADTGPNALEEGTKIHQKVGNALDGSLSSSAQNSFRGSNGAGGLAPDLTWGNSPGIWADLTTPGSWGSHVTKYGDEFGEGIPILYQRGVGVVNVPRLRTGAGVGLTGTQWITESGSSGSISSSDPCNYYTMTCSIMPTYDLFFRTQDLSGGVSGGLK